MAVVMQPLGSMEARGAVGGLVYNTWRGRSTVRTKVTPKTKPPGRREAIQALTLAAARRWGTLTAAQRAHWEDYANTHPDVDWTGNPKRIAGYHWYVRCNVTRQRWSAPWLDLPPTWVLDSTIIPISCDGVAPDLYVTWTWQPGPSPEYVGIELWLAGPHSAGRQMKIQDSKFNILGDADIETAYISTPIPGFYTVHLRLISDSTLIGPWYKITGEVQP